MESMFSDLKVSSESKFSFAPFLYKNKPVI